LRELDIPTDPDHNCPPQFRDNTDMKCDIPHTFMCAHAHSVLSCGTRDGKRMCKYSYLSGACANRHIDSLECVGENKCQFSEMNILTKRVVSQSNAGCGADKWLGLYCEKYKRFFCAGKDNCATPDSYMTHFSQHQDRLFKRFEEG